MPLLPTGLSRKLPLLSMMALRKQNASHPSSNNQQRDAGLLLYSRGGISVRVASDKEVKKFLRMRSVIFGKEYRGRKIRMKKDVDSYDAGAQQIILLHHASQTILGGCRVILSPRTEDYYCHLEYDISALMKLPGDKLEVSRVCIHPKHRNGQNFGLLWRGLLVYAGWLNVTYLFGMPSIKTTNKKDTEKFYKICQKLNYNGPILGITRPEFERYGAPASSELFSEDDLPTLMRLYLNAGGKVCSSGAVDHDLKCIDYLMVLKMSELHPRYRKWQEAAPLPDVL